MGCCLKARGNTKARGRGKKLLLAQITHSFKLTMLNVHHVTVCMKCEQNILGLGIPPPIILSLTIFSVAAIFRSLHGSRVRSHCICASVRPAGSPPVSQIVILKTIFILKSGTSCRKPNGPRGEWKLVWWGQEENSWYAMRLRAFHLNRGGGASRAHAP